MEYFVVARIISSELESAIIRCKSIGLDIETIGKVQDLQKTKQECCGNDCGCD